LEVAKGVGEGVGDGVGKGLGTWAPAGEKQKEQKIRLKKAKFFLHPRMKPPGKVECEFSDFIISEPECFRFNYGLS